MKVVAISDIHGYLIPVRKMPKGDVLCISGDLCPLGIQNDVYKCVSWFCLIMLPWIDSLPYKNVILIAGNHDFWLQQIGPDRGCSSVDVMVSLLPCGMLSEHDKLIYLFDDSVIIDNVKFYGTPWIADLKGWAFYRPDHSDYETCTVGLDSKYDNIPEDADVILSHMPPKIGKIGTVMQRYQHNTGANYGSDILAKTLLKKNYKWLLCGHVHSGEHVPMVHGTGKVVNVSIKDENYNVKYEPFVFEI